MTSQAEALYRLQTIELAQADGTKRLGAIAQKLRDNARVRAAEKVVTGVQQRLKPLHTQQRDKELQLQTTREKRAATEQRLYSGTVKNPKELQEMQQEIAALQRRDAELEEQMLELMLTIEMTQAELVQAEKDLEARIAEAAETHGDLLAEREQLQTKAARLAENHAAALQAVTAENLSLYQTLKPQKANRPISKLNDNSCSVCGIEQMATLVQEVRKQQSLTKCKNCGRILVYIP